MYSEELQRSHARPEPCDPPRSALTQLVTITRMKTLLSIKCLNVRQAVNCRF